MQEKDQEQVQEQKIRIQVLSVAASIFSHRNVLQYHNKQEEAAKTGARTGARNAAGSGNQATNIWIPTCLGAAASLLSSRNFL